MLLDEVNPIVCCFGHLEFASSDPKVLFQKPIEKVSKKI
jgi:hypothetical protein